VGVLAIKLYRPFPTEQIVSNLAHARAVIIMDRSLSPGAPSGPISEDVKSAMQLAGLTKPVLSVVYGIGGRDLSTDDGKNIFGMAKEGSTFGTSAVMYGVKV
jgi:pyruvate ferredoxin oxidoreductase alpha subunit